MLTSGFDRGAELCPAKYREKVGWVLMMGRFLKLGLREITREVDNSTLGINKAVLVLEC